MEHILREGKREGEKEVLREGRTGGDGETNIMICGTIYVWK